MQNTTTKTLPVDGCPALNLMPLTEKKQRHVARLAILAELTLETICQMAENEVDDATRAELVRIGTTIGENLRVAMA